MVVINQEKKDKKTVGKVDFRRIPSQLVAIYDESTYISLLTNIIIVNESGFTENSNYIFTE